MAKERLKVGTFISKKDVLNDTPAGVNYLRVNKRLGRGLFPVDSRTDTVLEVHTSRFGFRRESTVFLRKQVVQKDGIKIEEVAGSTPVTVRSITESGAAKKALRKYTKQIKGQ